MKRNKAIGIAVVLAALLLVGGVGIFVLGQGILANGDYYTRVDNAYIEENESSGVINLVSSEPYVYTLPAYNAEGAKYDARFGANKELTQDAYLKLEVKPFAGVVYWEEVTLDEIPEDAAQKLATVGD